jgi:predicted Zn-ribbon and HTH transcriptional regulator
MCDCIEKVNKLLEDKNTKLDIPIFLNFSGKMTADRVRISTVKRDDKNKKKPVMIQPAYCPFCGVDYSSEKTGES